jgi:uncharacterized delta-60 repeat protein
VELLESRTVLSGAGRLNPKFGVGGLVTTNFGANEFATTVATQPDGKIVVAGTDQALDFSSSQIAVARYNKDGSLDPSFGSGGKVLTPVGTFDFVLGAIVLPDGNIVVDAGEQDPITFQFENVLVQYNQDGTLDTSFGTGGTVVTPGFLARFGPPNPMTFDPTGHIVVVGGSASFTPGMSVAEFNLDGSLNQGFGSGGIATRSFVPGFPTEFSQFGEFTPTAASVAVDSQGRVLVGGSVAPLPFGGSPQAALFRFNPDGTLDTSFGLKGSITNVFGFLGNEVTAIAIRANGQIVVAGQASNPGTIAPEDFAVEQFNPDGTQDLRFGFDGVVGTTIPNVNLFVTGLAIQANGDLVVVGATDNVQTFFPRGFAMVRYTPDGNPDSTFGTSGIVTTFFPQTNNVTNVALEPDDNIVVAGTVVDPVTGNNDFGVAEYIGTPLAPSVPPPPPGPAPVPPPLFPPFPIVFPPPQPPPGPNGTLNPAFGTGGLLTSGPNLPAFATGIATQADGKIVAVGNNFNVTLVRYNPDGSLDQSFGSGGVVSTLVGNGDMWGSPVIQPDGKIVVASVESDPVTVQGDILVLRFNPDGSLDQSFGSGGIVTTVLPNGQGFTLGSFSGFGPFPANPIILTKDGRIIIVGSSSGGTAPSGLVIAEYDQNGNLVPGFGTGGLVIATSFTDSAGNTFTAPEANGVTLDRQGRFLVAGSAGGPFNPITFGAAALLARYNPDGSPDQTFGFHGAVTSVLDVAGSNVFVPAGESANAVAVRPDGKIVIAGNAVDPESQATSFAVEQLNSDGSPDLKFGSHGIASWSIADGFGNFLQPTSLVLQSDGSIVVAGSSELFVPFSQLFEVFGFGMIRLQPNGTFDPSFGSNGVVTANFPFQQLGGSPVYLAQEPNGNFVALETVSEFVPTGFFEDELGLAEYAGGSPDPSHSLASQVQAGEPTAGRSDSTGAQAVVLATPSSPGVLQSQTGSAAAPTGTTLSGNNVSATLVAGGTARAAFFAALSGGPAHSPSGASLDPLEAGAIDALFATIT